MSGPRNAADEFRVVEGLMLDHQAMFSSHGLSYVEMRVEHSKLLGDFAAFLFQNEKNGIKVRISYITPLRGGRRSFVVNITNPYGQKMNVGEYLRRHKLNAPLELFEDQNNGDDVRAFCLGFLGALAGLFANQLKGILAGKEWETIPFNWGDYK